MAVQLLALLLQGAGKVPWPRDATSRLPGFVPVFRFLQDKKKMYNWSATGQSSAFTGGCEAASELVCMAIKIVYRCHSIESVFGALKMILAGEKLYKTSLYEIF